MEKLLVVTHVPSPYQVELFDAVARSATFNLQVLYRESLDLRRGWARRQVRHDAQFLDSRECRIEAVEQQVADADLVVFGHYSDRLIRGLIDVRVASGKAWSFWGERPGFRLPGLAGRLVRLWRMRWLHRSRASIWGIGEFGVSGYRQEFGPTRAYRNIPYFSDLSRFTAGERMASRSAGRRVFLFSGSLIPRKGADLLARAFASVAPRFPEVRLRIVGDGPLRQSMQSVFRSVATQVEFLGFQDWDELPEIYRSADILCAPSRYDGWGLVVPEGLAAGLPAISTTKMGAGIEFIRHRGNGWLVEPGNLNSLVSALTQACSLSGEELAAMRNEALASVATHTLENGARRFFVACAKDLSDWR